MKVLHHSDIKLLVVHCSGSRCDRPFTVVLASCPMKPEMSEVALKIMNEEIVNACNSIDATSLKEIKELMIKDHNTEIKENGYWMQTLVSYVCRGLDDHTAYEQIVNAQTPETIAAFARQILAAGNKVEVVMLPEE